MIVLKRSSTSKLKPIRCTAQQNSAAGRLERTQARCPQASQELEWSTEWQASCQLLRATQCRTASMPAAPLCPGFLKAQHRHPSDTSVLSLSEAACRGAPRHSHGMLHLPSFSNHRTATHVLETPGTPFLRQTARQSRPVHCSPLQLRSNHRQHQPSATMPVLPRSRSMVSCSPTSPILVWSSSWRTIQRFEATTSPTVFLDKVTPVRVRHHLHSQAALEATSAAASLAAHQAQALAALQAHALAALQAAHGQAALRAAHGQAALRAAHGQAAHRALLVLASLDAAAPVAPARLRGSGSRHLPGLLERLAANPSGSGCGRSRVGARSRG